MWHFIICFLITLSMFFTKVPKHAEENRREGYEEKKKNEEESNGEERRRKVIEV